jgi:drug/metabolite transporter (DMT)-like permease
VDVPGASEDTKAVFTGALSLGYVGPIATDFTYWAIVEAGSHLRASTMAMALLATPPLGIAISACALHESLDRTADSGRAAHQSRHYADCNALMRRPRRCA